MKYDHDYRLYLSIGYSGASREGTVNPSESVSREDWDAMTKEKQIQWLQDYLTDWADSFIETSVTE